jgi:hypothetical protein
MSSLLFCDIMQLTAAVTAVSVQLSVQTATVKQCSLAGLFGLAHINRLDWMIGKSKTYTYNYFLFYRPDNWDKVAQWTVIYGLML